jgi:hypothetical protein
MEGAPPNANQIDLFMHFLGASRDGLVARRVDLDTISSSESGPKTSCHSPHIDTSLKPNNGLRIQNRTLEHVALNEIGRHVCR